LVDFSIYLRAAILGKVKSLIRRVVAKTFHKFMTAGRTSPVLLSCEPEDDRPTDYVVKLAGGMELGTAGLIREVIASQLAAALGISRPTPSIVLIEADLAELIAEFQPDKAAIIQASIGNNFGSELMKEIIIWPVDRSLPDSMIEMAGNIFAFDSLIQNPDRRFDNPNLVVQREDIRIFDHESAFSFLLAIFPSAHPWQLGTESYLDEHVFFNGLHKRQVDWTAFIDALRNLPTDFFVTLRNDLPEEWNATAFDRIEEHITLVIQHADDFELELRRRLA
jgi:hypothetical protein